MIDNETEAREASITYIKNGLLARRNAVSRIDDPERRPKVEDIELAAQTTDLRDLQGKPLIGEVIHLSEDQQKAARLLAEFYYKIQEHLGETAQEVGPLPLQQLELHAQDGLREIANGIAQRWFESGLPALNSPDIGDVFVLITRSYGEAIY